MYAAPELLRRHLPDLPSPLPLPTIGRAFSASITPPGSKSLTNRALLLAALTDGESVLHRALLDADDADAMIGSLRALGAIITASGETLRVRGVGGCWRVGPGGSRIMARDAGTVARFLGAAAMLADGPVTIDGAARLRQRPMADLGRALDAFGCAVQWQDQPGHLPLTVTAPERFQGGVVDLASVESSQFLSALLMVGPWLPDGVTLRIASPPPSGSYIAMTLGLLSKLGAEVRFSEDYRILRCGAAQMIGLAPRPAGLAPFTYHVEPDASGATYFLAAAALVPGSICTINGLGINSLQGDAGFASVLERMGATVDRTGGPSPVTRLRAGRSLAPILADMEDMPDAVPTLAVVASWADGTSIIRGVRTLRVKESDRIAALCAELAKIGVTVQCPVQGDDDAMTVTPPLRGVSNNTHPVVFETYNDHRMAMALSLVALRRPGVSILNPACVAKTYPTYWRDFSMLYGAA